MTTWHTHNFATGSSHTSRICSSSSLASEAVALLVSFAYEATPTLGLILGIALVAGMIYFSVWWSTKGCYRVIGEERRQEISQELLEANAKVRGQSTAELVAV